MPLTKQSLIYVAGHRGMVGSARGAHALHRAQGLQQSSAAHACAAWILTDQSAVHNFFREQRPDAVILAAARVGGINANSSRPALFIRDNLLIQSNVIDAAHRAGVKKFVFWVQAAFTRGCLRNQIEEEVFAYRTRLNPPTNGMRWRKLPALRYLCQAYRREFGFNAICLMPTNLYGPGDNFDLNNSHVFAGTDPTLP